MISPSCNIQTLKCRRILECSPFYNALPTCEGTLKQYWTCIVTHRSRRVFLVVDVSRAECEMVCLLLYSLVLETYRFWTFIGMWHFEKTNLYVPSLFKHTYWIHFTPEQIMQMHCMTRRLKGTNISVNSCHPGVVETEITRNFEDSFFWRVIFFKGTKLIGNHFTRSVWWHDNVSLTHQMKCKRTVQIMHI